MVLYVACSEGDGVHVCVFVRVGNILYKHSSAEGGVQIRFVVWDFMLRFCFLTRVFIFSSNIGKHFRSLTKNPF